MPRVPRQRPRAKSRTFAALTLLRPRERAQQAEKIWFPAATSPARYKPARAASTGKHIFAGEHVRPRTFWRTPPSASRTTAKDERFGWFTRIAKVFREGALPDATEALQTQACFGAFRFCVGSRGMRNTMEIIMAGHAALKSHVCSITIIAPMLNISFADLPIFSALK